MSLLKFNNHDDVFINEYLGICLNKNIVEFLSIARLYTLWWRKIDSLAFVSFMLYWYRLMIPTKIKLIVGDMTAHILFFVSLVFFVILCFLCFLCYSLSSVRKFRVYFSLGDGIMLWDLSLPNTNRLTVSLYYQTRAHSIALCSLKIFCCDLLQY